MTFIKEIEEAARAIRQADALLVTAGAGMGVDSGLPDFRGDSGFWNAYPPYAKLGLSFVDLANPRWFDTDPAFAWGFYGHRLSLYRKTVPHAGFAILRRWCEDKPGFVFTSNVDGQFQGAGFDPDRIYECHGAIDYIQCTHACGVGILRADDFAPDIDESTFRCRSTLPKCPRCSALMRPNVLMFGDADWDDARSNAQARRFEKWLESAGKLAVIECGAGTAVPSVRNLGDRLAAHGHALVRINIREPQVPRGHIGLALGAGSKPCAPSTEKRINGEAGKRGSDFWSTDASFEVVAIDGDAGSTLASADSGNSPFPRFPVNLFMKSLLEVVRKKCPPGLWSQGVKLAREGSVVRESEDASQVTVRVRAPRFSIPPTVTLYPEDEEWSCDCGGKFDPCEHVAAAVIALTQPASEAPKKEGAHVAYRLTRQNDSLYLERFVGDAPLKGGLATLLARGAGDLVPTHDDLALDRIVGATQRTFLPVVRMPEIFALLATSKDVTLDGAGIRCSTDAIAPRAVVRDTEEGVVLRIERDPRVTDVVARGVVRIGEVLHPIREAELTGDLLEKLPRSRPFTPARFPELVTEVIPELESRIDVEVKTQRLPRRARTLKPRILLELGSRPGARDATLGVVPLLVYGDPPIARVDGDKLVHLGGAEIPTRDEAAEKKLLARLRDELDLVPGRRVDFIGPDAQRFATKLKSWAVHDPDSTIEGPLVPKLSSDAFDLRFESANGERRASAEAALRAFRDGLDVVPLEGGGFAPLPLDWLQKHGSRLADLFAARDARGELPKAAELQVARFYAALEQPAPPRYEKLAALLQGIDSLPEPSIEANATLRAYQHAGVRWLSFLRDAGLGAILADDMGLGKTLQTICAIKGRTLVVCPKSVLHNWAEEIAKFRPSLRTSRYHGPKRALDRDADVVITTYAVLRLDIEMLRREPFDAVVLDEAQFIKNPDSQAARAAFSLDAGWRLALSGTPVENRLDELWSLFHFASPGLLGARTEFGERLASPIARGEDGAAERLREIVKPFLLRRKKRDVAPELPPRTDVVLHVELDEQERAVYDAVRAATTKDIVERMQSGGVLAALEALLRLRQAACHPALVPGQKGFESSSKVDTLVERLEDAAAEGHKALVFSQWTSLLDLIEPQLRANDIAFNRLDGSTADRGAVVSKFQADDGPPVMLVSLKAGGTGLNLTAADHVFLVDPWWNPAVEDQAADRAHRIGQDKPVFVHRLVAKDTVEEGILALQEKKRAIADAALATGAAAAEITREELLALLG